MFGLMKYSLLVIIILYKVYARYNHLEDARLNFTELATKYGQKAEEFDVITEDGYILKLFHIIGDKRKPVLLVHGALGSGDGFIIRGNLSLAINLARHGHDVWAINHRGNRYSRRHLTFNPDEDRAFWDFNLHHLGNIDLPDTIDFIQNRTESKISIVGYSQGTTVTIIMGATKPEYNDRVKVFIALAPICFVRHFDRYMAGAVQLSSIINRAMIISGAHEFAAYKSVGTVLLNWFCARFGYELCRIVTFEFTGRDEKQFEPEFMRVWMGHFPAGTSREIMHHLSQMSYRNVFARYDYGPKKNMKIYGSEIPPEYEVKNLTMKTAIFTARNDYISTMMDVDLLRKKLPNVVEYRIMKLKKFNHLDFIWGHSATYNIVLPQVIEIVQKYDY